MTRLAPILGLAVAGISSGVSAGTPVPWSEHRALSLPIPMAVVGTRATEAGTARGFFQALADQGFACAAEDHARRTLRRVRVECRRGGEAWTYEGGFPVGHGRVVFDRVHRDGALLGGTRLEAHVRAVASSAAAMVADDGGPVPDPGTPVEGCQAEASAPGPHLSVVAGAAAATVSDSPRSDCAGLRGGRPVPYRNGRYGLAMTHPSIFALDPGSVPENGDSAQFWTADRSATAIVTGLRNSMRQPLADLLREAERDIVENSRGAITYRRARGGWFVLSGFVADRIFYRRTFLSQGGGVIATLWIEFPRGMRPCFDDAVTMMSRSFKAAP